MPLTTLHLVALSPGRTIRRFLQTLHSQSIKPLVASKVVRWIIQPEKLSTHLTNQTWDILLILPATTKFPPLTDEWIFRHWSITAGVPKGLTTGFEDRNRRLLFPRMGDVPELQGGAAAGAMKIAESAQALELSPELLEWSRAKAPAGAVSMFNLLSFRPGREAHESYLRYGKSFAQTIGAKRGGNAKIVGRVVPDQGTVGEDRYGWDEVALAHYPSVGHFVDMLGSVDYQEVNHRDRLPALRDTCILCTTELDEEVLGEGEARL